jgi:hypothetical protein
MSVSSFKDWLFDDGTKWDVARKVYMLRDGCYDNSNSSYEIHAY